MNILVTGGVGFIGSHLVDKLVSEGHSVVVFDNLEEQVHVDSTILPDYYNHDARFIKGDMRSFDDIKRAVKDADVIFHQAAMVGVGQSMYQISRYVEVNSIGTANLLQAILDNPRRDIKLIVASSMSIYGEGAYRCEDCGPIYPKVRGEEQLSRHEWELFCPTCGKVLEPVETPEDKPLDSTSIYAITKKDQEEMVLVFGKAYKIPVVALRYFNVYGPRQSLSNPYTGVCAIFSSRIKNGKNPIIYEDGNQTRNFVSVHDIVDANILAMKEDKMAYQAFNVGSRHRISILEVARILSKLYGKNVEFDIQNKFRAGDIRHCFSDISKIREFGYEPKVSFEDGMKELVEWGETVEALDRVENAQEELMEKGLVL